MREFGSVEMFVRFLTLLPTEVRAAEHHGLEAAGVVLAEHAKAMIGTEDKTWAPLVDRTVEEKERLGFTGRISPTDPLLRTGDLRDSIKHTAEQHEVMIGSDDPIAVYQELGTVRIPPRSFIAATMAQHGHKAADLVADHMMGAVAGLRRPIKPI